MNEGVMRHSTEEKNALYEDMLERKSTPLYGPKVYMVHRESGEYSGWTYDVKGIFSTYEAARRYVEHGLTEECRQYVDESTSFEVVEVATAQPKVRTDEHTFWAVYPHGERVWGYCGSDPTWFITEYAIDEPVE